jgi:hypothetical protein
MRRELIGMSIAPRVATQFMDRVSFDDLGRIQGFPGGVKLRSAEISALRAARIVPLTEINATVPGQAPRTERECLVRFLDMLGSVRTDSRLLVDARALWMSGNMSGRALGELLKRGQAVLQSEPALRREVDALLADTRQKKTWPQYHDNIYGRRFETMVVQRLVADPPAGAIEAVRQIASGVLAYLDGLQCSERRPLELNLAELVGQDRRSWFGATPEIDAWLHHPTPDSLAGLFRKIDTGFDAVRAMYLAQKLMMASQNSRQPMPWLSASQRHYDRVICPARSDARSMVEHRSDGFGIGLNYHPAQQTLPHFEPARHHTYTRIPNLGDGVSAPGPTTFERGVLKRGQALVTGSSGTATMFGFMVDHMVQHGAPVSRGDATLAGIMFMTFDTGHSVHEVLATTRSIEGREFVDSAQLLNDYDGGYEAVARLPVDSQDREKVRAIMNDALDDTVNYFATHVKSATPNERPFGSRSGRLTALV